MQASSPDGKAGKRLTVCVKLLDSNREQLDAVIRWMTESFPDVTIFGDSDAVRFCIATTAKNLLGTQEVQHDGQAQEDG